MLDDALPKFIDRIVLATQMGQGELVGKIIKLELGIRPDIGKA